MLRPMMLAACLSLLSSIGCQPAHEAHDARGHFAVMHPLRTTTKYERDYVAQIRAIQHIELRALERGYLQGTYVDEGSQVRRGQKMFQILPVVYQAEVQKAQAEADLRELEFNNTKLLADQNIVSPNELALARAKVAKAKAQLTLAATHQGLTEIHAPFDGIMGRFSARKGSLVDEGDLLTTLADNSSVWVYFNVTEAEYLDYKSESSDVKSTPVQLVMANGKLFPRPGRVETIEADFNNETGNIAFRAAFENPDGLLRHGETGKVRMTIPLHDVLVIPQSATYEVLDKKFVFVVDEHHVVHSRPITVSVELPQLFVVADGINEHDTILIDGLRKVRDGSLVDGDLKDSASVVAHLEVPAE